MDLLNLEDEKTKTVTVGGYSFKIKAIGGLEERLISKKRVEINGIEVDKQTQDEFMFALNCATVDICTVEYPKGFKQNES